MKASTDPLSGKMDAPAPAHFSLMAAARPEMPDKTQEASMVPLLAPSPPSPSLPLSLCPSPSLPPYRYAKQITKLACEMDTNCAL